MGSPLMRPNNEVYKNIQDEGLLNTPEYKNYIKFGNTGTPNWGGVGDFKNSPFFINPQPTKPPLLGRSQTPMVTPQPIMTQQIQSPNPIQSALDVVRGQNIQQNQTGYSPEVIRQAVADLFRRLNNF